MSLSKNGHNRGLGAIREMKKIKIKIKKNMRTKMAGSWVQLNKYETAPNFIQLSQNLTSDCLLI